MTDQMFNELLEQEVKTVSLKYRGETHYQIHGYLIAYSDGPLSTAVGITRELNAAMASWPQELYRIGQDFGKTLSTFEPEAIFIIQDQLTMNMSGEKSRAVVIYGITNDARYSLAILPIQTDEDGRVYAEPTVINHWSEGPLRFKVDVLRYLEFFKGNDQARLPAAMVQS